MKSCTAKDCIACAKMMDYVDSILHGGELNVILEKIQQLFRKSMSSFNRDAT